MDDVVEEDDATVLNIVKRSVRLRFGRVDYYSFRVQGIFEAMSFFLQFLLFLD